jgi:hypothetical protein
MIGLRRLMLPAAVLVLMVARRSRFLAMLVIRPPPQSRLPSPLSGSLQLRLPSRQSQRQDQSARVRRLMISRAKAARTQSRSTPSSCCST